MSNNLEFVPNDSNKKMERRHGEKQNKAMTFASIKLEDEEMPDVPFEETPKNKGARQPGEPRNLDRQHEEQKNLVFGVEGRRREKKRGFEISDVGNGNHKNQGKTDRQ